MTENESIALALVKEDMSPREQCTWDKMNPCRLNSAFIMKRTLNCSLTLIAIYFA